jgi:hypothetical protein
MRRRKYSSMAVGGGVHGKVVGTAHITMTEVGVIIGGHPVFTVIFILVGEMISGIIDGEGNRGNITGYITMIFVTIGVIGKEPGTGTMEDLVIPVEADLVGTEAGIPAVDILVEDISVEDIPVEDIPVADILVTLVEAIPVEVIPEEDTLVTWVEDIPVAENLESKVVDLANPVVVHLVSAEENPVYNLVPINREMKNDKKDRIVDHAA